jgi:hypothetical protein
MLMLICAKNDILSTIRPSISKSKSNGGPLAYAHALALAYCCVGSQTKMSYD